MKALITVHSKDLYVAAKVAPVTSDSASRRGRGRYLDELTLKPPTVSGRRDRQRVR